MLYVINGKIEVYGPFKKESRSEVIGLAERLEKGLRERGNAIRAELMLDAAVESCDVSDALLRASFNSPGGIVCVAEFVGVRAPVDGQGYDVYSAQDLYDDLAEHGW